MTINNITQQNCTTGPKWLENGVKWVKDNPGKAAVAISLFVPAAATKSTLKDLARQAEVLERFEKYQAEHPDMSAIEKSGILAGQLGGDIAKSLKKHCPEIEANNAKKTEKEVDSATKE